jgi:hypothetical protein
LHRRRNENGIGPMSRSRGASGSDTGSLKSASGSTHEVKGGVMYRSSGGVMYRSSGVRSVNRSRSTSRSRKAETWTTTRQSHPDEDGNGRRAAVGRGAEEPRRRQKPTSIHLQNSQLYMYGVVMNLLYVWHECVLCTSAGPSVVFQHAFGLASGASGGGGAGGGGFGSAGASDSSTSHSAAGEGAFGNAVYNTGSKDLKDGHTHGRSPGYTENDCTSAYDLDAEYYHSGVHPLLHGYQARHQGADSGALSSVIVSWIWAVRRLGSLGKGWTMGASMVVLCSALNGIAGGANMTQHDSNMS